MSNTPAGESLRADVLTALRSILSYIDLTLDDLLVGCEDECDGPRHWPLALAYRYLLVSVVLYAVVEIVGVLGWLTSGYRCEPCNSRRGGVSGSRHKGGFEGGEPHAAVDYQWDDSAPVYALLEWVQANGGAAALGDLLRRWTGLNVGVGLIFYSGARRIHLDVREGDYLDVQI